MITHVRATPKERGTDATARAHPLGMTADEWSQQRALKSALRDIGVTLLLIVVTFQLFARAEKRRPEFSTAEIQVIAGTIASFTTVQVSETAAAPQHRSIAAASCAAAPHSA